MSGGILKRGGENRPSDSRESCISCSLAVSKTITAFVEPPALLPELSTSKCAEARHFPENIRMYNSTLGMAPAPALFESRGLGPSKYNPNVTVHGRMCHEIRAAEPATGMLPRFASL